MLLHAMSLGLLVQGVTVSNEFPVDAPVFRVVNAERPAVAFDGVNYLVVWSDERTEVPGRIYGVRVDANGAPLGPNFYIGAGRSNPDVAFDGANFLVVAQSAVGFPAQNDVSGVRVSPAGVVLDTTPISIASAGTDDEFPAVAGGNGGWLVVWTNGAGTNANVLGARVSGAGVLLDTTPLTLSNAANAQGSADVAFDGTRFFAVWRDFRGASPAIYGARVSTAGVVQDTAGLLLAGGTTGRDAPAIAFDGTRYLVAFASGPVGTRNIDAVRVSTAGAVVGGVFSVSANAADESNPAVTWTGANYVVGWNREVPFDAWAARVDGAGAVLDASPLVVAGQASAGELDVALASNGSHALVVWRDTALGVAARRLSSAGTFLDATARGLVQAPNVESGPQVAFDGANALVVWRDGRNGNADIYAARVTPAGASLDGTGLPVATSGADEVTPAVGFGGGSYLVVWMRGGNIYGRRYSPAGAALGAEFAVTAAAATETFPRLAFDGTNFLVVFRSGADIAGVRVTAAGAVLDATPIAISTSANDESSPDVGFDGTQFKVFWDSYISAVNRDEVWCRIVSTGGVPAGTSPVTFRGVSGSSFRSPRVAMGPGGQVVASISSGRVVLTPVGGGCLPPVTAASATVGSGTSASSMATDGTHFLVTWSDTEGVKATMANAQAWPSHPTGFAVTPPYPPRTAAPAVVALGTGSYLLVYEKADPGQLLGGRGMFRTLALTYASNGTACADGTQCNTGYCIDGVCCNTSCGGGDTTDCQGCSTAAGAAADGTCGFLPSTHVCAPAVGPCDVPDTCPGNSQYCWQDTVVDAGTVCRAAAGACDVAEVCDGMDAGCPADGLAAAATVCRASAGACDLEEVCTGSDAQCPADGLASATMACRASAGECDVAEACTGSAAVCPMDGFATDGTPCSAGTCQGGLCVSADAGAPDAGTADAGAPDAGTADAGPGDSGTPETDAGTSDAGTTPVADAGTGADGGVEPTTPGGCGCSGGPLPWDGGVAALALLGLLRSARRRRG
ncbi:MAG: hypothetical protein AB1938_21365 [Myxococcota bacterium]